MPASQILAICLQGFGLNTTEKQIKVMLESGL